MTDLLQSSTQQHVIIGPMIDSSDHISAKTGLTLTVTISKNGASFASPSGAITEIGNGFYKLAGNATDTNTLGTLAIHATGTGADPWDGTVDIVAYNPQVANATVNVIQWSGTNVASPNVAGVPLVDLGYTKGTVSTGAAGYVGLDWGQMANKTTTNTLSATTVSTNQNINSVKHSNLITSGTVTSATPTTITIPTAMGTSSVYVGDMIYIYAGTGINQVRTIVAHNNTTITIDRAWGVTPDNASSYTLLGDNAASLNSSLQASAAIQAILSTTLTETSAGYLAAAFKKFFDVAVPVATTAGVDQAGDSFGRIGVAGAGLTALPDPATLMLRLTSARAGYLDNINVGGVVASQADVQAINTSSSKHLILTTVGQYERPESGSTIYTVEARTYNATTGAAVNADSTPTLTATGQTTGSLAANLSAATNPATGVSRWTYTVTSAATNEPVRFDLSAVISSSTFTLSAYTQVVDFVSVTFSSTDQSHLTSIYNKLPLNNIADETLILAAIPTAAQNRAEMDLSSTQLAKLGTPAGASVSADIAGLNTKVGTPAGASVSADIATVNAKTTNLPTDPADASDIATATSAINTIVTAISTKLGGITLLKNWLAMIMGKTPDAPTLAEVNATTAGAGYSNVTDSLERLSDNIQAGIEVDVNIDEQAIADAVLTGLAGQRIEIASPVIVKTSGGLPVSIEIVQGADYRNANSTALILSMSGITAPSWAGGTPYLDIDCGGVELSIAGTLVTATGSSRSARFDLTAAQSATLTDSAEDREDIDHDQGTFDLRIVMSVTDIQKPVSRALFIARRPAQ